MTVAAEPTGPAALAAPGPKRRFPLRATGRLAIVAVMALATLLVASALVFRGAVQSSLETLEGAHARHSLLLALRLDPVAGNANAARLQALDNELRESDAARQRQLAQTRRYVDGGTVVLACLAWLGITCIGALALLFFSRLATDIDAVRARALAIVIGDRGPGRPLTRTDELGELSLAVNSLALALGRHERDLEIERRHVMHHERLAAIGSMAAGVLREIGNPIAAIDGYARALADAQRQGELVAAPGAWCEPRMILDETARLLAITHEISELAAAPASQCQLTNLNEIVTQSLALLRYESRLEAVAVAATLDPQLPALLAVADRLVQLLTNLMINAADATAALPPHTARIEVATRADEGGVELCVADNGCGMNEVVRERAFEPLFTTKPAGRGTGLGLPLCRTIAQDHGGRIALESAPGAGTRVTVWLPLEPPTLAAQA
jgi:two-component system, NtrC family, sensor kinase